MPLGFLLKESAFVHNNLFFLKYIYLINKKNFTMKTCLIIALVIAVAGMIFRLVICVRSTTPQITYKEDKILETSRVLSWGLALVLAITAPICLIPWMWLKVALMGVLWMITIFVISTDLSLVWAKPGGGNGNSNTNYYSFLDSVSPYTWDRTSSDEYGGGDC